MNSSSQPWRRVSLMIVAVLSAALSTLSWAQQPPPEQTEPAAEAPPGPAAIPASDVAARAEETSTKLRAIRKLLVPEPAVVTIEEELPGLLESLEQLRAAHEGRGLETRSLRALDSLRQQWLRYQIQLTGWQQAVQRRSQTLATEDQWLDQMNEVWDLTRQSAQQAALPQALQDRIAEVRRELEAIEKQLDKRLDVLLTLQDSISRERTGVDETLAAIDAAQAQARQRLLNFDSPALWDELFAPREEGSLAGQVLRSWQQNRATMRAFRQTYQQRMFLHAVLLVALLGLMYAVRAFTHHWETEDTDLQRSLRVLRRPLAASLLIGFLITPWVYPNATGAVTDLALLAAAAPVLRLLPPLVYREMRPPLYGLTALYVLQQLYDFVPPGTLLRRLMLLLVGGLALAGLLWVLRPQGPFATRLGGRWWRAVVPVARIGMFTLGAAIIANVIGIVGLADLLLGATLNSAFLAVLVFAGTLVLTGLVRVLLRTRPARAIHAIRWHAALIEGRLIRLMHIGALLLWVASTLSVFNILDPIVGAVAATLTREWAIGAMTISLGDIFAFALTIWIALLISRFVRFILQEDVLPRMELARGVPGAVSMLSHYVILLFGFVLAVGAAGFDMTRFTLIAGALGVGIGFGLQGLVNNFVSGLILAFERPIQVGDTIEIGTLLGEVRQIGLRSSTVRTFDGAEVVVPNGNLTTNEVINWTLSDQMRRIEIEVGVAYGTDPEQVLDVLLQTARTHSEVVSDPEPYALFTGFGDSSLDFSLRFWTHLDVFLRVRSEVTVAVNRAIAEAGIEIPLPQRDLHVRSVDVAAAEAITGQPEHGPRQVVRSGAGGKAKGSGGS